MSNLETFLIISNVDFFFKYMKKFGIFLAISVTL